MIEQRFEAGESIIHGFDPRARIIIAAIFSIIAALADRWTATILALLLAWSLVLLARLPLTRVIFRLLAVNGLILLLWFFLPFSLKGREWFTLGPLVASREGVFYVALITIKANAIILVLIGLVSTMPIFDTGRAMRCIRIPAKIIHLILFTYRYVHVINKEYQRALQAIKIRGFHPKTNLHTYRTYAHLVGMLLVRSYDRAERVRAAMLCRGFTGRFYDLSEFKFKSSDWILSGLMVMGIAAIVCFQWIL